MNIESFFVAIDGDLVGRKIERLIISNKLDELIEYSHSINKSINSIRSVADTVEERHIYKEVTVFWLKWKVTCLLSKSLSESILGWSLHFP